MPIIVRRKRPRRTLTAYRRHELLTGKVRYPNFGYDGYGDGEGTTLADFIDAEMISDWKSNRKELMAFWLSGKAICDEYPGTPPWLFVMGERDTLPWAAVHLDDEIGA
jgi:hypothetical protein